MYNNGGHLINNKSVLKYNSDGVNSFFERLKNILLPKMTTLQRKLNAHNLNNLITEFKINFFIFLFLLLEIIIISCILLLLNINFNKKIERLKKYPLSDQDIKNILDYPTKIHNYLDIQENTHSIDEILDSLFRCIILIPTGIDERSGHWIALLTHDDNNIIEYFDPYGFKLNSIHKNLGAMKEYNPQWLKDIIKKSGYKLEENKKILQTRNDINNATCGRLSSLKITLNKMSNKQFGKWIDLIKEKYKINPQDLVVLTTE